MRSQWYAHDQAGPALSAALRVDALTSIGKNMTAISYSIQDVAGLLGLSRTTIYKLINDGRLKRIKVGARTLIPAVDVQALVSAQAA